MTIRTVLLLVLGGGLVVPGGYAAPLTLGEPDAAFGPPGPAIAPVDRVFLVRLARRVMDRQLRQMPPYEVDYLPPALEGVNGPVAVTLRRSGRVLGRGVARAAPVIDACSTAARLALADATKEAPIEADALSATGVEVELLGPRERIGFGSFDPVQFQRPLVPGVHGVVGRLGDEHVWLLPSELVSSKYHCPDAPAADTSCEWAAEVMAELLKRTARRTGLREAEYGDLVVMRFRSTHLYSPAADEPPVALVSGLRYVPAGELTEVDVRAALQRMAGYLVARGQENGLFAYEYFPGLGLYRPHEQNYIRQAATTWVLARYARLYDDDAAAGAANRALEAFKAMARPVKDVRGATFVATPDGDHALGTSALVALALTDAPPGGQDEPVRRSLLQGLASMQLDDGSFKTHYWPSTSRSSQDYYPGEALLAIARGYERSAHPRWREVADRALGFYRAYYQENRTAPFVPWQAQAWGQFARATRLSKYADFVFAMVDDLVATQIPPGGHPATAIYDGGFDVYGTLRPGISSAVYLEGVVDAWRTAKAMGDDRRRARYREVILRAGRFVLQLQFRAEECYYVLWPTNVVDGVRTSPSDPALRIDHVQHAMAALMGVLEVLQETPPQPATQAATGPSSPPH